MKSAIDQFGRVVIPKAMRDRLGLESGHEIEIIEEQGAIEIRPAAVEVDLVETPEGLVAVPRRPVPVLTVEQVREKLDQIRR